MTNVEVIKMLKGSAGVSEAYHIIDTYMLIRNEKSVFVRILDAGPGKTDRYHCHATDEDEKIAVGNPDNNIEEAIRRVHWELLDR